MKKVISFISLVVCNVAVLGLVGCDFADYNVTYVEDAFNDEELASDAELIKDYETLEEYISNVNISEELQIQLETYDKSYFEDKMLIIICHWESSDATRIEVDDVDYEGTWVEVNVDRDKPDMATDYEKNWGILVEIKRDDNLATATYTVD